MSQSEIIKLLKKNKGKWMGSREMAKCFGRSPVGAIMYNLMRLRKSGDVEFRTLRKHGHAGHTYEYKWKEEMKENGK